MTYTTDRCGQTQHRVWTALEWLVIIGLVIAVWLPIIAVIAGSFLHWPAQP